MSVNTARNTRVRMSAKTARNTRVRRSTETARNAIVRRTAETAGKLQCVDQRTPLETLQNVVRRKPREMREYCR